MKSIDIKRVPKISIILYSLATIMTICTIFITYKSNVYISGLVEQGFNPSKEIVEVINYYIVTVTPYVFYTICLFTLGYIVNKVDYIIKDHSAQIEIIKNQNVQNNESKHLDIESKNNNDTQNNDEDEIDEFFKDV